MLDAYLTTVQELLQNPPATNSLYATSDLTNYINIARNQLAGEAECIRQQTTLALAEGTRVYAFSSISLGGASGVQGVFNVRQVLVNSGTGQQWVRPRPFEWFTLYRLNNPSPAQGIPNEWSQYAQGTLGSIYVDPIPNGSFTLTLDSVCQPIALVSDASVEAIPYPWTDAVPFFAAYYAYLSAQRSQDADAMLQRYEEFVGRARRISNPSVMPYIYEQASDPTMPNQLALRTAPRGGP